jgi:acyl carrier protein
MSHLWEETLGVRPIGLRDNFFDLGGHSLLAVRLFARLEKEFGRKVPLSVLYEAPTVEQLAALMRQKGWSPSWRSLVPIQPQGSKPPFFGLPGIGGNVLNYAGLARVLGSDQPFYGLQARGLDGKEAPFTSIEDMATHHIQELRTVQPHGPYYLIGSCIGGVIAFEMAHQLLALLETWPPEATIHRSLLPRGMLGVPYVRFVWQRLAMYGRWLVKLTPKDKCAFILKKVRLLRSMIATGEPLGDARTEFNQGVVERANRLALKQYALRPYSGRILHILAGGRRVSPEQDTRMVWRNFATEGTEVYTLPTSSSGRMLTEPYVRVLADHLSAYPRRHGGR